MNIQNQGKTYESFEELYKDKQEILFMWIIVNGESRMVCEFSEAACRNRAKRLYGDYEIEKWQTQTEFMEGL